MGNVDSKYKKHCEKCNMGYKHTLFGEEHHCCNCKKNHSKYEKHCCNCSINYNWSNQMHCCKCKVSYLTFDQDHCCKCHGIFNKEAKHKCNIHFDHSHIEHEI